MERKKTKIQGKIEFVLNGRKAIHAILYIIQQHKGKINQYNLLKIIFEADKYHLNKYGRPVTGDIYRNMSFGTVPDAIYNTLKGRRNLRRYLKQMGMKELPYKYNKNTHMVSSSVPPNHGFFVRTTVEALKHGIKKYGDLGFDEVKEENHKEKCWLETERNQLIPFELIIENKEVLKKLSERPFGIVI